MNKPKKSLPVGWGQECEYREIQYFCDAEGCNGELAKLIQAIIDNCYAVLPTHSPAKKDDENVTDSPAIADR